MGAPSISKDLILAMGYRDDGWTSSWLHAEQLAAHLKESGQDLKLFAPSLGQVPHWWHRRLQYPKSIPNGDMLHLVDPAYGDALLSCRNRFQTMLATITDIAFWRGRTPWNILFRWRIVQGLRQADYRVAISAKTAKEMQDELGLAANQVIYLGTEPNIFNFSSAPRQSGLILHVGTTTPRKGIDRILRLLPYLPSRYRLWQVGGQFNDTQRQLIAELNLGARVTQTPTAKVSELVAAYQSASLFVFPSRYEGYGVPCVEARLCGTPVALSDEVPAKEVLNTDPLAQIIDFAAFDAPTNSSPEAMEIRRQQALAALLKLEALGVGDPARREWFSWTRVADEYRQLYRRLGERPST